MNYKERYIELYNQYITREGAADLLSWMTQKTDFFTAPASTRFHLACEGGLVQHSVNVTEVLLERWSADENPESLAICGLLHDLCKTNFYKVSTRNVKNEETGQWEKVPFYMVEDAFPYGHGEKSVFMIERFVRLKTSEAMAIRWHMGGFDDAVKGGSYSAGNAFEKYPLAVKMHLADIEASYLIENRR
jgi:hypothetical protein